MIARDLLPRLALVVVTCVVVGCSSSFGGGSSAAEGATPLEICEEGAFHPTRGLSPARKIDYVSVRGTLASKGGGTGPTDHVTDEDGGACKDATDTSCQQQVDGMALGSGWPQVDGSLEYVLVTVKDDVIVYPTTESLLRLLGTIDTVQEAALLARTRQQFVDCSLHPQAYADGDHYRVLVRRGSCIDAVIVQRDGTMTIQSNVQPSAGCQDGIDFGDDGGAAEDASTPPGTPFGT